MEMSEVRELMRNYGARKYLDANCLIHENNGEFYVFFYNDKNRGKVLKCIGRFAENPDLLFNWYDVTVISHEIRQEAQKHSQEQKRKFGLERRF